MSLEAGIPSDINAIRKGQPTKVAYVGAGASYVKFYVESDPMKLMSPHMSKMVHTGQAWMQDPETGERRLMEFEDLEKKYPPRLRVEITTPQRNNRKNVVIKDVNDAIKRKYAPEWALYKEGKTPEQVGLALVKWEHIDAEFAEELKIRQGLATVEQLAEVTDDVARTMREGFKLRSKARAYVSDKSNRGVMEHVNAKNDALEAQLAAQSKQIEELKALILDSKGNPAKSGGKK